MRLAIALAVGVLLGVLGARFVSVGWLSLIPWSLAGLALGLWSGRSGWALVGASYGFALAFAFMIAGYSGAAPLAGRLPFFAIIGVAGAVYGLVLGRIGSFLRTRLGR